MRSLQAVVWLSAFLALSGLALMFLFVPQYTKPPYASPAPAGMTPGSVFLGLHFWGSNLIVLAAAVHLVRTVFVKTNRRRFGWALAIAALTGLFWLTGMLLP